MDKYTLPQHLDAPFKLMLWTVDELVALFLPFLSLMWGFNSPLIGLALGGSGLALLKKLKGEQGHFFLHHLVYWYLPGMVLFKQTPPSHLRAWIG